MEKLTRDYDLKRALLGDKYDEERPIINILRAKKMKIIKIKERIIT